MVLLIVTLIILLVILKIFKIASLLDRVDEKLFAYGVGVILSLEFLINAFGISGIIPIKGVAVPLLSYGGSQIVSTSLAIGMVLMLSRKVSV